MAIKKLDFNGFKYILFLIFLYIILSVNGSKVLVVFRIFCYILYFSDFCPFFDIICRIE